MTDNEHWTQVCVEDDMPFLEGRRVEVGGFYVGLFNTEEGFFALYDGDVAAATVTCPLHARKIDLRTGVVLNDEMLSCTFTFPVKIEGSSIYLDNRALAPLAAASPA